MDERPEKQKQLMFNINNYVNNHEIKMAAFNTYSLIDAVES